MGFCGPAHAIYAFGFAEFGDPASDMGHLLSPLQKCGVLFERQRRFERVD